MTNATRPEPRAWKMPVGAAGPSRNHSRPGGRRHPPLPLLACLLAVLGGCASLSPVDVVLVSIEPVEATLLEQRLRLNFRVQNAGQHALRVTGLDVTLNVNDQRLAKGVDDRAFILTGASEARLSVVASTTIFDVARQLLALPDREAFSYELSGRLHVDGSMRSVRFRRAGEISRDDLRRLVGAGGLEPRPLDLQP